MALVIAYLLLPLTEMFFALLMLRKRPLQFGIPELLLLPIAFIPTVYLAAAFMKQGEMEGMPALIVVAFYQISGGCLPWTFALAEHGKPVRRWLPALLFVVGAWFSLIAIYIVFIILANLGIQDKEL